MLGVIVPLSFLEQCNYQWSMELHLIYLSASHTDTYIYTFVYMNETKQMITVCLIYWISLRAQHANGLTEVSLPAQPVSFAFFRVIY